MRTSIASVVVSALAVAAAPGLDLKITGPSTVNGADHLAIKATLVNTGDSTLRLLNNPNSVLTPQWKTATFTPTNAQTGARPQFKGAKVKWGPAAAAAANDVTTLAPGQTLVIDHNLAGVYNFTTSGAGSYEFTAPSTFETVSASGAIGSITANAAVHTASITGSLSPSTQLAPPVGLAKRAITFTGCSSSQQSGVSAGANQAASYAGSAVSYANSISSGTARYTTWFGAFTSAHLTLIRSHYTRINDGQILTNNYDCTCTDAGTYAYVYPDQPGKIYLCPVFFSTSTSGTDSKGGTIIHESSHFTKNGGTQDYVYGQTGCKNLAKSNSNQAVMNADSHEYFAENTPAQS